MCIVVNEMFVKMRLTTLRSRLLNTRGVKTMKDSIKRKEQALVNAAAAAAEPILPPLTKKITAPNKKEQALVNTVTTTAAEAILPPVAKKTTATKRKEITAAAETILSPPSSLTPPPTKAKSKKRATDSSASSVSSSPSTPSTAPREVIINSPLSEPTWLKSCIRFEDNDLVIISKPAGIASQPGGNEPSINDYLEQLEEMTGSSLLRSVHRLDRDTSGLLMLARSKESAAALSEGLREGSIKKYYIGLSLSPPSPIISSSSSIIRTSNAGQGFSIVEGICKHPIERTQWKQGSPGIIESSEQWSAETLFKATTFMSTGFTIWRLSPLTGRRHQLRQHVLELTNRMGGLIGDSKYYGKSKNSLNAEAGLMLHAFQLTIPANTLGQHQVRDLIVREELPERIQKLLRLHSIPSRIIAVALD